VALAAAPGQQPPQSVTYQQTLEDARQAWAAQSGLTVGQVKSAYQQASASLGAQISSLPQTAPATKWNMQQMQGLIDAHAANLDQRVMDSLHAGIRASYYHAGSAVVSGAGKPLAQVFGDEAVDSLVRDIGDRAATAYLERTAKNGIKLSDSVWNANAEWRSAVQSIVSDAIVSGTPPLKLAQSLEGYLNPGVNQAYKAETAKRLHVPKDTSMPAMRLARTEMLNSFHEGTINQHSAAPSYLGITWKLSGAHPIPDVCNDYAAQGFFAKGTEPTKPHPHCFCIALPVHEDPDEFQGRLEDWLNNPGSHADIENFYQQKMKPLLDVEVQSVAGASGGPLLGGYAKGDKVTALVNGQEYTATVLGEHATKGVLRLKIDPGQGINSVEIWRAPSKLKEYTAAPIAPPAPVQPIPTGPAFQAGDTVQASIGKHTGKVGVVTAIDNASGLANVKWTDGTTTNTVLSNLSKAPPPVPVQVGYQVKLHLPELPSVNGMLGTVTAVHADGSVAISTGTAGGTAMVLSLDKLETFKLEVTNSGPQTIPGLKPWSGATVQIDAPGKVIHGLVGTAVSKEGANWLVQFPGMPDPIAITESFLGVQVGQTAPPVEPPKAYGYIHTPGPDYGKAVAKIVDNSTVQWMDGSYGHNVNLGDLHSYAPQPQTAPTPPAPPPAPVQVPPHTPEGSKVDIVSGPNAGKSGVVQPDNPYLDVNEHTILLDSGEQVFVTTDQIQPAKVPTPTPVAAVDVTQKGTVVSTDYKGTPVKATVQSYNAGKNVLVLKPLDYIPDLPGTTFTKSPKLVQADAASTPLAATVQTQIPTPPVTSIDHLKFGDEVVINMPGSPDHGKTGLLFHSPALFSATEQVTVEVDNLTKAFFKKDLLPPGAPLPSELPKATGPVLGDTVSITDGPHTGKTGKVSVVMKSGNLVVDFADGSTGLVTPVQAQQAVAPTPTAAPVAPTPTGNVTDKGSIVTTDYKGVPVTAKVSGFNQGKNVVVLKPINPPAGVPPSFTKHPGKVQMAGAQPTATTAAPLTATTNPPTVPPPSAKPPPVAPPAQPPDISTFTVKPMAVGGGHTKTIYSAPDGRTWMFKPDANAAYAEKAGYNVMGALGFETPQMHVMTVGRELGSMQQFHQVKDTVRLNGLGSLTVQQRADIQQHQVVDWLISQHDTNDGAMLIGQQDQVLAIDKGQAFKFLGRDKLHWTYKPNPNQLVYEPLFEGYIQGKYVLDRGAIEPVLSRIEAMSDTDFVNALRPYAEHAAATGLGGWSDAQQIYDLLLARKRSIRADFMRMYDEADKLAGRAPKAAPSVTTNHVTPIAQPLVDGIQRAGWAGQSIMVAGADIESGNVLAYNIRKSGDGNTLVLESKVRSVAEPKLLAKLDGVSHAAVAGKPNDPTWNQLLPAIKHVGYHLKPGSPGFDSTITESKLTALRTTAQEIASGAMDPDKAAYYDSVLTTLTGWTAGEIATQPMAGLMTQIKHWWSTSTAVHNATFDQYTPPTKTTPGVQTPADKIKAKTEAPWAMQRALQEGELVSTTARSTGRSAGHEGSGVHTLELAPGVTAVYTPHNMGGNPYSKQGRLQIYAENWTGTPAELQQHLDHLTRLGLDDGPATPDETELLYLHHQAHAAKLEDDYSWKAATVNKYTPSMTTAEKVQLHLDYWNQKLGVPDVRQLQGYSPRPQFDNTYRPQGVTHTRQQGGWAWFQRFDVTKAELDKAMPGWGLTHNSSLGAEGFVDALLSGNGQMATTEERIRSGVYNSGTGMSSSADMGTGGANYFFTRISKPTDFNRGQFVFDTDLLLRTDMISYDGDRFGRSDPNTKQSRNTTIADWKKASSSGGNEAIFKNGFPLMDYVKQIRANSAAERLRIIQKFKARGVTEIRGKPVEDVVTVGGRF
jgi:ribosomal protein L24